MESLTVVNTGSIDTYRNGLIEQQEAAVRIAEEIVKVATDRKDLIPKVCLTTIDLGEARLKALRAGFLPAVGIRLITLTKTPIKKPKGEPFFTWEQLRQRRARSELKTLPPIIHEAIEEAESMGIFKNIAMSDPRAGDDPVIVGKAGGWNFLIASWVTLMGGQGVGFRFRAHQS